MTLKMQTYKTKGNLFIGLLLFCLSSHSLAFELKPFSLNLEAQNFRKVNISLDGIQSLAKIDNNQWKYRVQTLSSFIKVVETSDFIWAQNTVTPQNYSSYSRIAFVKTSENANFDSKTKKVVVKRKKDKRTYPFKTGIMDPNSFQIKMMQELTEGKKNLSYRVQQMGGQTTYNFRVVQSEQLKTPMGKMEVLKIEQVWNKSTNKEKYFWVSENYGYIPLLIENFKNGKIESRIRVTGGYYDGKPIKPLVSE